ncbi:MAG: FG-GAP repeat protein [Candidatus Zixiibacteriota bacterium]|nr:MAG: FG-GAP repeat protein [candidate division Zixibacteria bacterium]
MNDDGYDDLIAGARGSDNAGLNAGRAYIYSGRTGSVLCTLDGEAEGDWLGYSVSGAGDINNDGYDELIVGAPLNDAGGADAGRAYVFSCQAEDSFVRGDANGDGIINVGDIVYLVSYLYKSGPAPDPVWVGDCNCDEIVNVGDIVFLVSYLYKGGPEPVC